MTINENFNILVYLTGVLVFLTRVPRFRVYDSIEARMKNCFRNTLEFRSSALLHYRQVA
jgi:hypothetical protein